MLKVGLEWPKTLNVKVWLKVLKLLCPDRACSSPALRLNDCVCASPTDTEFKTPL